MTVRVGLIAAACCAVMLVWYFSGSSTAGSPPEGMPVSVIVPQLDANAMKGAEIFERNCAACHGQNAAGSESGPPLVHKIYEPGHHADLSFLMAARQGVRAHHWPFGNMPPVDGVTDEDVASIVYYVRTLQKANGIF